MKRQIIIASALALLAVAFLRSTPAAAQVDVFVRIGTIQGGSSDAAHKNWIDAKGLTDYVQTYNSRSFVFTKKLDRSTPLLKLNALLGKRFTDGTIEICRSGGDKSKILQYQLRDVVITSVKTVISNNDTLEEVTIDFGSVEWDYLDVDENGKPAATIKGGWDMTRNKPL